NVIAFAKPGNGENGSGVVVKPGGTGNRILGNSIHDNAGVGIDLGGDGPTANDLLLDGDTGANKLQNFPVIVSFTRLADSTKINFILDSAPSTTYRIEFFNNESALNPNGRIFLGSTDVTTDQFGNFAGTVTVPVAIDLFAVTATATDPGGNTSELSGLV